MADKLYKSKAGQEVSIEGIVLSVTGTAVDNTDPKNPVISSTASGGDSFTHISENQFGTHPAFTSQHKLNIYLLGGNISEGFVFLNFAEDTSVADGVIYPQVHLSSDYPELTTSKKYFLLYSTDHSSTGGGIYWAECDDLYGGGFIERGIVISGYQAETPFLLRIPSAVSGISEELFLFYHTLNEPGHTIQQETRLKTTSGGSDIVNSVWTDRGRPLGVVAGDNDHTGYCRVWKRNDGLYVAHHITSGTTPGVGAGISTSPDGLNWTRITSTADLSLPFVAGRMITRSEVLPFIVDGSHYGIVGYRNDADSVNNLRTGIFELDEYLWPSGYIKPLGEFGVYDTNLYLENGIAHYFKYLIHDRNTEVINDEVLYIEEYKIADAPIVPVPTVDYTIALQEDFNGTTVDTSKGTITNPDSADLLLTQDNKLIFKRITDTSIGAYTSQWNSVGSFGRGAVSVLMNRDIGYEGGKFYFQWKFSPEYQILIWGATDTPPRTINIWIKHNNIWVYQVETGLHPDRRVKIVYDANDNISFWYWNISEWQQMGTTQNYALGTTGTIMLSNTSDGVADDVNDVFSFDELRVTDKDYTTELP